MGMKSGSTDPLNPDSDGDGQMMAMKLTTVLTLSIQTQMGTDWLMAMK